MVVVTTNHHHHPAKRSTFLTTLFAGLLLLLLSHNPILQCNAKTVSGRAHLNGVDTEHTVVKFSVSPGGTPKFETKLSTGKKIYMDESKLKMYVYSDENWNTVKQTPLCSDKIKLAKLSLPLQFNPDSSTPDKNWVSYLKAELNPPSPSSELMKRPMYWYITIADCSLELYMHDEDAPPMEYTLTIWDDVAGVVSSSDGSRHVYTHLPSDEQGMSSLNWYNVLLSLLLGLRILMNARDAHISRGEVHLAALMVAMVCGLSVGSSLCEIIHLAQYARNGVGSYTFDFFSAHLEAMCDAMIALMLLAVGVGWTLPSDISVRVEQNETGSALVRAVEGLRNPGAMFAGANPAGALAAVLLIVHAVLAQWGRTYDDDFDCYHDLEHLPGRILFVFRIFLGFCFLLGVAALRRSTHCSFELGRFLGNFGLVGFSWFMALPSMAWVSSSVIPPYRRHQVVSTWALLVQLTSLASLAWLFTSERSKSSYHKVSKIVGGGDMMSANLGGGGNVAPSIFKMGKTKIRVD